MGGITQCCNTTGVAEFGVGPFRKKEADSGGIAGGAGSDHEWSTTLFRLGIHFHSRAVASKLFFAFTIAPLSRGVAPFASRFSMTELDIDFRNARSSLRMASNTVPDESIARQVSGARVSATAKNYGMSHG